jgi:hypothetical protein
MGRRGHLYSIQRVQAGRRIDPLVAVGGIMSQKVNYSDNIFFLSMYLKVLINSLKLDLDTEVFSDHYSRAVLFLADVAQKILTSLQDSPLILGRVDYLKEMQRFQRRYVDLIDDLLKEKGTAHPLVEGVAEKIRSVGESFQEDIEEIRRMISDSGDQGQDSDYTVSEEEYRHLFTDED